MIIHSITPIQMLVDQPDMPQIAVREIDGGYVEGYETPQGFHAMRLNSTDPSMYLRGEYAPGSILNQL